MFHIAFTPEGINGINTIRTLSVFYKIFASFATERELPPKPL
jgi:hypothetical protein